MSGAGVGTGAADVAVTGVTVDAAVTGITVDAAVTGGGTSARPEGFTRVAQALQAQGHPHAPLWLEVPARTAQEAADVLGVTVGQVAKSVIFRRKADGLAVLVVTSGDCRVDEKRVAAITGALGRADADFVKARTGFSIGGVSPLAHTEKPVTLIDRELFRFETIWAAAGHPNGVFQLSPQQLVQLTGAPVADVVQQPTPPGPPAASTAAAA